MAAKKNPELATAEKLAAEEAKAAIALAEKETAEKALIEASQQVRPGMQIGNLIATSAGLPNTCAATGKEITEGELWFAAHEDAARSGQGFCVEHAIALAETAK